MALREGQESHVTNVRRASVNTLEGYGYGRWGVLVSILFDNKA